MEKKIAITSDCVCDLSEELLEEIGVEVIYFYIRTSHGCFRDMDEITSGNVVEYFENGGQYIDTEAPKVQEYETFFERKLKKCDELIHINITSELSQAYRHASKAAEKFGGRVHVFDTGHLSSGIGHIVLKADELIKKKKTPEEILEVLQGMKDRVSTSFIVEKADYLYRTGRVNKAVMVASSVFKIHPVLAMKNGKLKLKTVEIGAYEKAVMRYIRKELKKNLEIDKKRVFITHSGCTVKLLFEAKQTVLENCAFEEAFIMKASSTISSNCGANALAIMFVRNERE